MKLEAAIAAGLFAGLLAGTADAQTVRADVPYVPAGTEKQRLDLFLPDGAASPAPVVLLVHGGSLTGGDRKDAPWPADVCRTFASSGFVCAAASYRLFPSVGWPAPAEDVAAAFAWLRREIEPLGGDPGRIALVGHSSGCLVSTLVASDESLLGAHGLETADILGVVAIGCRLWQTPPDTSGVPADRLRRAFAEGGPYERYGTVENLMSSFPMNHVGPHLPPFLVLIAEEERFKPPILEDAATYVGLARDCRVDADLAPAFRLVADFLDRLSREGPREHLSDPDGCPPADRGG